MLSQNRLIRILALALSLLFVVLISSAKVLAQPNEILLGMSAPLTGPIQQTGKEMKAGTEAALARINAEKGIRGVPIRLIMLDDAYDPMKGAENTKRLIEQDKVVALVNINGTPVLKAVVPIAEAAEMPLLFPRTGDSFLRDKQRKNVVNLRRSFNDEIEAILDYLVEQRGFKKIALLEQTDALGVSIKTGVNSYLRTKDLRVIASGTVGRGSAEVEAAFKTIEVANPEAVVLAATTASASPFLEMMAQQKKSWVTAGLNHNSTVADKKINLATPLIVSQVIPDPASDLAIAKNFRADLKSRGEEALATRIAFEAYVNLIAFASVMRKTTGPVDKAAISKAFSGKSIDLGGIVAKFDDENFGGSIPVNLTQIIDGKIVNLEKKK